MAQNRLNPDGPALRAASKPQGSSAPMVLELLRFGGSSRCILRLVMKVFLSSTAQDLVAHRCVVDDTILRLSPTAAVMDHPVRGRSRPRCWQAGAGL